MTSINKWSDTEATNIIKKLQIENISEDLALRTYSARLLGSDPELVLHGGGNTSVKSKFVDISGEYVDVLCVKGSGWDLATIEPPGHPAVRLNPLLKLKNLKSLSDEDMVSFQRRNLLNPNAPNPSVETLLHAFIPEKFIDHTHSLAILALANQPNAAEICKKIFKNRLAIVPYVMPGFDLSIAASKAYEEAKQLAKNTNQKLEGMLLINHGLFTFGETAKISYERMIGIVQEADQYLSRKINLSFINENKNLNTTSKFLPYLRGILERISKKYSFNNKWIFDLRNNQAIEELFSKNNLNELIKLGVATPDHVIRTKSHPLLLNLPEKNYEEISKSELKKWMEYTEKEINIYIDDYANYFKKNNLIANEPKKQLDPLPRFILLPKIGLIGIGNSKKSSSIAADIGQAWVETLLSAESIGCYKPVNEKQTFDLEYWSLEQAKLGKTKKPKLGGYVVAITGAGGVIGSQIAKDFSNEGAEIIAIDLDEKAAKLTASNCGPNACHIGCDITNKDQLNECFDEIIYNYGGLDILICNAGAAWEGSISDIDEATFRKSMELNFYAHLNSCQRSLSIFHSQDFEESTSSNLVGGQILFNISKQAINPGPNFGSYGITKSALTSLMRQISLEEGKNKIRSNGVNADRIKSGLLNSEMIKNRSLARGISEEKYMSGNLLESEVYAEDVSKAFLSLAFMEKTTGALLSVDGGNVAAMVR